MKKRTCSVAECATKHYGHGYCRKHLRRWRSHGTPTPPEVNGRPKQPVPSLQEKMETRTKRGASCWIWEGAVDVHGYGNLHHQDKRPYAHRVAYELAYGEIPKGARIDHICRTPLCVNPDHLRPVDIKRNAENHGGPTSRSTSGKRGVYWDKEKSKWWVQVAHHRKRYFGGYFDSIEAADEAARRLRNSMWTHNEIDRIAT